MKGTPFAGLGSWVLVLGLCLLGTLSCGDGGAPPVVSDDGLDAGRVDVEDVVPDVEIPDTEAPEGCVNGVRDGLETDVDCGGGLCLPCGAGLGCEAPSDCLGGVCLEGVCAAASCEDGLTNGDETDVDCGGAGCAPCEAGSACAQRLDCVGGVCQAGVCRAPACDDGVLNGPETDVDCGGGCGPCEVGARCVAAEDCGSGVCGEGRCLPPACADGILNGLEADVDCGGECALCEVGAVCRAGLDCESGVCGEGVCGEASCEDGRPNGDETDVDCGGGCPLCEVGLRCGQGSDCVSGVCGEGLCQRPSCVDGAGNGFETDVDCGGGRCAPCGVGSGCVIGADCVSGVCGEGVCQPPVCEDGRLNGDETDVDCGGLCGGCVVGQVCDGPGDCADRVCLGGRCRAPSCTDGLTNGGETGLDCGGECVRCGQGLGCLVGGDCLSGVCEANLCASPSCADGIANGDETDIDCGGFFCGPCGPGLGCEGPEDCREGACNGGFCLGEDCEDGRLNGDETDVDCGGVLCRPCIQDRACVRGEDCLWGVCEGTCRPPTCVDEVRNGDETDVDCGGFCPGCEVGAACDVGTDCLSAVCEGGRCLAPRCGDGVVQGDEGCDDGNGTDGDGCSARCVLPGCGDGVVQGDEGCDDGNGIDGDGCTNGCALPRCGDGVLQQGEVCDDGNDSEEDACSTLCEVPRCGDGVVDGRTEACDNGEQNGDAPDACRVDCRTPRCGDGIVDSGEGCDDGDEDDLNGCRNGCVLPFCGDGVVQQGEGCDDGNRVDFDGCSNRCTQPACGDGILQGNEQCDDGNPTDSDACTNGCTLPRCGDGVINGRLEGCDEGDANSDEVVDACRRDCQRARCGDGVIDSEESCDDGNRVDTDGCSNRCLVNVCGDGNLDPGEECDDGDGDDVDGCSNRCLSNVCGNSRRDSGEECDDGNPLDTDGCTNGCRRNICGNGRVDQGEQCDDGNALGADGCGPTCQVERCGNGFLDPGEQCDDGGEVPGDGCSPVCFEERCGNGRLDPGEACDDGNGIDSDTCTNACVQRCLPRDCRDQTADCGPVDDGCGGALACGGCPEGETCGGHGEPGICGVEDRWPSLLEAFEIEVIDLVNIRRAQGARCGEVDFEPALPLHLNTFLRESARRHSLDMALNEFVDHVGTDGSSPAERIAASGYEGPYPVGENVAGGQRSPEEVVEAWMDSPEHCVAIMDPAHRELGVGLVVRAEARHVRYWTQNFGGEGCQLDEHCESQLCRGARCVPPACDDGLQNGDESDIDCGGDCGRCGLAQACDRGRDCESRSCVGGVCVAPACDDGVRNGDELRTDCGGDCGACELPPDPVEIAPPLDRTGVQPFLDRVSFLFEGDDPIQAGVDEGTIEGRRAAVIRGQVTDRQGLPLGGVSITVLEHPEFGLTMTRADGVFDLVVNGGGLMTVVYALDGYHGAQRRVDVPWRDFVWAEDVVLVALDVEVTEVTLGDQAPAQTARGSVVEDRDGRRQATLFVPSGTRATLDLGEGEEVSVDRLNLRATEYTVGPNGRDAMPGPLPPTSGYTYAVELSADEAIEAGADSVRFSQPVVFYLENFLGFPVGGIAPVGFYDRRKGAWIPSDNGLVIGIVGVDEQGLALLDLAGQGEAADEADLLALGVGEDERRMLADDYEVGQSLWRVLITHMTPFDINWPYPLPLSAVQQLEGLPAPLGDTDDQCAKRVAGGAIECENQTLRQAIPIAGTGMSLNYRSDKVPGRRAAFQAEIPVTGDEVAPDLQGVSLEVSVAGQRFETEFAAEPNQSYLYEWDGLDAYGRQVQGKQQAQIEIKHRVGSLPYAEPAQVARSFGEASDSGLEVGFDNERLEVDLIKRALAEVGQVDAGARKMGGWSLGAEHTYDADTTGNRPVSGSSVGPDSLQAQSIVVSGSGEPGCEPGVDLGVASPLNRPTGLLAAPDGSLYVSDSGNHRVLHIKADGETRVIAGDCVAGDEGDNGPAGQARLNEPRGMVLDRDGNLYIADTGNHRVRMVDGLGVIRTVAGTGDPGSLGDGDQAIHARLHHPHDVALDVAGQLYIADTFNHRIRRVGLGGRIATVDGEPYCYTECLSDEVECQPGGFDCVDPEAACQLSRTNRAILCEDESWQEVYLRYPRALRINSQGEMIIADTGHKRVLKRSLNLDSTRALVGTDVARPLFVEGIQGFEVAIEKPLALALDGDDVFFGTADTTETRCGDETCKRHGNALFSIDGRGFLHREAGNGVRGQGERQGIPGQLRLSEIEGVAVGPDGRIFYSDTGNHFVRVIEPTRAKFTEDHFEIPRGGATLEIFDPSGHHMRTERVVDGAEVLSFERNEDNLVTQARDLCNNTTEIERDEEGHTTGIEGPFGQRTELEMDPQGYLSRVVYPGGRALDFEHTSDGLLTSVTGPDGLQTHFNYNEKGLLTSTSQADSSLEIERLARTQDGIEMAQTSAMGRRTVYQNEDVPGGKRQERVSHHPDGTRGSVSRGSDGLSEGLSSDGSRSSTQMQRDPLVGMAGAFAQRRVFETPSGLRQEVVSERRVEQVDPREPRSVFEIEDSVTVNDRTSTTRFEKLSPVLHRTTTTTPSGRSVVMERHLHTSGRTEAEVTMIEGLAPKRVEYDDRCRMVRSVVGDGDEARETRWRYYESGPANGMVHQVIDPVGRVAQYTYDNELDLVFVEMPGGRSVTMEHDEAGRTVSISPPGRPAYRMLYDERGLPVGMVPPAPSEDDETDYSQRVAYNLDRQQTRVSFPEEAHVEYHYSDTSGRLERVVAQGDERLMGYDEQTGQLIGVTTETGQQLHIVQDGPLVDEIRWEGPVTGAVQWGYDNDFRITSQRINEGHEVSYEYDQDGLLWQVGGMLIEREPSNGQLKGTAQGQLSTSMSYDGFGAVRSSDVLWDESQLFGRRYEHDGLGRIVRVVEQHSEELFEWRYGYDASGRLISVEQHAPAFETWSFEYDANGNRTLYEGPEGSFSQARGEIEYDAQDRLLSYGPWRMSYTDRGTLSTKRNVDTGEQTGFEYDLWGNLKSVDLPDDRRIEYLVDGANRRVGRVVIGANEAVESERFWLYQDGLNPIAELDGEGQVISRFIYGTVPHLPDTMIRGGRTYRFVSDHLGSLRLVVDVDSGQLVQRFDYDAFGNRTMVVDETGFGDDFQPFGFVGGIFDAETGLVRFGARDYDPVVGRWTAKDPIGFNGKMLNLYGYANHDPINLIDLNGLDFFSWATEFGVDSMYYIHDQFLPGKTGDLMAGIGDAISLGMFRLAREALLDDCNYSSVDYDSPEYFTAVYTGQIILGWTLVIASETIIPNPTVAGAVGGVGVTILGVANNSFPQGKADPYAPILPAIHGVVAGALMGKVLPKKTLDNAITMLALTSSFFGFLDGARQGYMKAKEIENNP